ncbi:MAG: serine/threonine-protein kinase [Candidatus Xenobia bacterium]
MEFKGVRCCAIALLLLLAMAAAGFARETRFISHPGGAKVYRDGVHDAIATTNQTVDLPDLPSATFRFVRDGYQPKSVFVYLPQQKVEVDLEPAQNPLLLWGGIGGLGVLLAGGAAFWLRRQQVARHVVAEAQHGEVQSDYTGRCMGPYLLTERLGSGGAGEVYRGQRQDGQSPGEEVAVKLVRIESQDREMAQKRLAREVELLRRLKHSTIVQYLDMGHRGDTLYLVEELLPGGHLGDVIPTGGLTPARFLELFMPMLDAMQYAHERGVVHRDLKPGNVLFTRDGRPRISDFGLARGDDLPSLTTNNCMGTPLYMAPELFNGQPATPQSDQYALGIMAYEMLSGTVPYSGDSIMELVAQRIKPPPPLSERMSQPLPPGMEQIVLRMLAFEPKDRFPSLAAVRDALGRVQV